jgi:hypothetical protein
VIIPYYKLLTTDPTIAKQSAAKVLELFQKNLSLFNKNYWNGEYCDKMRRLKRALVQAQNKAKVKGLTQISEVYKATQKKMGYKTKG